MVTFRNGLPKEWQGWALLLPRAIVNKAKLGNTDKSEALKKLREIAIKAEKDFIPNNNFEALIEKERNDSWKYGGKTVFGDAKPPKTNQKNVQLKLF